jgi:hypothetical protein
MAYIDFAEPALAPLAPMSFAPAQPIKETAAAFSRDEWTIINLARNDGLSSLREESPFKDLLRQIFGIERKRPLANPRLESIRRIAVLSWHYSYNVASSEIRAFFAAGFSPDHYDAMLAHIGAARVASARKTRR